MAPSDEAELARMVVTAAGIDDHPSAIRYPRGEGVGIEIPKNPKPIEIGKGRILREGKTVAILSLGTRLQDAMTAAEDLAAHGFSTTVADARFAKPVDADLVRKLAQSHDVLITVEEAAIGGFSAQVLDILVAEDLIQGVRLRTLFMPDRFIDQDKPDRQVAEAGLDSAGIVKAALAALEAGATVETDAPARA